MFNVMFKLKCFYILDPQNTVEGDIILEDVLACTSRNRVYYRILLTTTHLILQDVDEDLLLERFAIEDMFGCSTLSHTKHIDNNTAAYIYFYFYPKSRRKNMISNIKYRQKLTLIFEVRKEGSREQNMEIANSWRHEALNILGTKYSESQYQNQNIKDHPDDTSKLNLALSSHLLLRKFLIVLNPKSGKGKSIDIFQVQM